MRHLFSVDDLTDADISEIIIQAQHYAGQGKCKRPGTVLSLATIFLQSSLRTKLGFAEATIRLGGVPVDISQTRFGSDMSHDESFVDSLRVVTGTVDIVAVRTGFAYERGVIERHAMAPVINAGNGSGEHPTQALIDAAYLHAQGRPVIGSRLCLCGDLRSRVATSAIRLFARLRPAALLLVSPPSRRADAALVDWARCCCDVTESAGPLPADFDVIDMIGLPRIRDNHVLEEPDRAPYRLTRRNIDQIGAALVISPLPNIDEIESELLNHTKVVCFDQSDFATSVRMAIIEWLLA